VGESEERGGEERGRTYSWEWALNRAAICRLNKDFIHAWWVVVFQHGLFIGDVIDVIVTHKPDL
jgi:hypothetical protein